MMLTTDADTTYEARIEHAAAVEFEARIGQGGFDRLHEHRLTEVDDGSTVGDWFAVGECGAALATLYDALCNDAAHNLLGPVAMTESELF